MRHHPSNPGALARARRRPEDAFKVRVWAYDAGLVSLAVVLTALFARHLHALTAEPLAFPIVTVTFALAELLVVDVHVGAHNHSFSMSEAAVVIGLLFARPIDMVLGQALGLVAVLVIYRRLSPMKVVFNLGQFAVTTLSALLVFHAFHPHSWQSTSTWFAALASVLVSAMLGVFLVSVVIAISRGRFEVEGIGAKIAYGAATGLANGSLMIQAVALANISTWLVLLSMLPIVVLFIAYRGYNNQRRKHETIEVLYQATMALHESPNIDAGLVTVLDHASRALRGEFAQLVLFTPDGSAVTSVSGPGDSRRSMTSVPPSVAMVTRRLLAALTGATRLDPSDPAQATFLEAIGARNGVAAPLTTDSERSGLLVVGNRLGSLGTFDIGDVKLMSLLANQVNVALERGWLERSLSQLIELEKQLKHQAYHDPLTGLANRSLFGERVSAALVAKVGADHAVLLIDLDDFKTVNDSLGHAAGDELLTIVAARISGSLRPTDLTARIGGDEFAVLLENIGGLNAATDTAQRIIDALRAPIRLYTQEVVVRASIGIAMTNAGREELGEVLRNADMALYHAKSLGKGQHAVYEARMHQQASERLELTAALAQAVERHEFALRYQPIHDLMSGDVIGVETLVRWLHPMRGEVRPDQFVTLAEETGLIVPMGAWVLEESCLQLARWTQEFRDRPRFSTAVNMSARQLQHPGFVEHVRRVLLDTKIEPSRLTLELTESVLIEDSSTTLGTLAELKALGVRLAIDDFGTGFSSLNYVHRFPIDALKIDRSFVNTLGSGSADSALVSAIVQLASSLGLSAVAEGLETSKQLEELRRLGCRYGQGYLFSAPMEADEIGRLLRRSVPTVPFLSRN